jgi:AraC family transcriptional regulator, regulatory protein of adaptative response / DNA-3-methyladenine glycosylase II
VELGIDRTFPRPADLADASLDALRMPGARKDAIRALASALTGGSLTLDPGVDRHHAREQLLALRGIGPWTADYAQLRARAEHWAPWRSYATHYLWESLA